MQLSCNWLPFSTVKYIIFEVLLTVFDKQIGRNPIKPAGALDILAAIAKAIETDNCGITSLDLTVSELGEKPT